MTAGPQTVRGKTGQHPEVGKWVANTGRRRVIGLLVALLLLGVVALFSVALLWFSIRVFDRSEGNFAEVL